MILSWLVMAAGEKWKIKVQEKKMKNEEGNGGGGLYRNRVEMP